jgi:hypothetical protein
VDPIFFTSDSFYAKNFKEYWWISHVHLPQLWTAQGKEYFLYRITGKTASPLDQGWKTAARGTELSGEKIGMDCGDNHIYN